MTELAPTEKTPLQVLGLDDSSADMETRALLDGGVSPMGTGGFFGTLINSVNILLGVAVLSMPFGFAKGGWMVAPAIVIIAISAGYTAKLLGLIQKDVVQVKAPDGMSPAISGYYLRCLKPEGTSWQFEKCNDDPTVQRSDIQSSGPECECTVTWLPEERRWVVEMAGDKEGDTLMQAPLVSRLEQYPDIGKAAFGMMGHRGVHFVFTAELYLYLISLVILVVENVHHLNHKFSKFTITLIYTGILIPTSMIRDFSRLSFLSYLGLIAAAVLLFSVIYFGLHITRHGERNQGSFINYSKDTRMFVPKTFSYSFSLIMGCFAGHSLYLSFRASMARPGVGYPKVVYSSFSICALYCLLIGVPGYLMYGQTKVKDILSLNFDPDNWVTYAVAGCVAIVSYSKHGLASNVLSQSFEQAIIDASGGKVSAGWVLYIPVRLAVTLSTVVIAYHVPNFGRVMGLLGAAISCTISLIFPMASYMALFKRRIGREEMVFGYFFLFVSIYFAITGTLNSLGVDL